MVVLHFLIFGANGATGSQLVRQLLEQGHRITAVVRNASQFEFINHSKRLSVVESDVNHLTTMALKKLLIDVDGVGICLGYNMSFTGVFAAPKNWLSEFINRLRKAAEYFNEPPKLVLMNSSGNINAKCGDTVSLVGRLVLKALYLALPPHRDNVKATKKLMATEGHHAYPQYCVVRPASLVDKEKRGFYTVRLTSSRCPITNDGKVRRINVAHFMATLLCDNNYWQEWKGKQPVIYDCESVAD